MASFVGIKAVHDRDARLDQKVGRELAECILKLLADEGTEDICLNPDGTLWAKRTSRLRSPGRRPRDSPNRAGNDRRHEGNRHQPRAADSRN